MPWLEIDTYHVPVPAGTTICCSLASPSRAAINVPVASKTSTFASSPDGLVGTTEITAPVFEVVKENVSTSDIRSMMPVVERPPAVSVSGVAAAIVPPKSSGRKPSPPVG